MVFTGDTSQIDAPYLGESNNALAVLIQAFAGQRCFGHVTLTSCERSDVASLAAELLCSRLVRPVRSRHGLVAGSCVTPPAYGRGRPCAVP